MARLFKQFFPPLSESSATEEETVITRGEKIYSLVKQLTDGHIVVKLSFTGLEDSFKSTIRKIDPSRKFLIMERILSARGHEQLMLAKAVIIKAQFNGAVIRFQSQIKRYFYSHDDEHYELVMPEKIYYSQRRNNFRVKINTTDLVPFSARHKKSPNPIKAVVRDIGMSGIGLVAEEGIHIQPGDQLSCCSMQLSNTEKLNFTLEVRFVLASPSGSVRIGGRFKDLNQRSSMLINRFVRKMERISLNS